MFKNIFIYFFLFFLIILFELLNSNKIKGNQIENLCIKNIWQNKIGDKDDLRLNVLFPDINYIVIE